MDIDPHEPEAMVPSMVLDFGPGPSVTAPPSPSSSASAQEVENGTTIQDKKRKIRSAEAQPLMPSADEALPAQVRVQSYRASYACSDHSMWNETSHSM